MPRPSFAMPRSRYLAPCALVCAALLALTACSSSKKSADASTTPASTSAGAGSSTPASGSSSSSTASTPGVSVKIGVITDSTGPAASGYQNTEKGIKAYADAVNATGGVNGHKIEYVMGDSQSTPSGALTAAQKLVQTNKVFAILSVTSDFYGAEPYLLKQNVPVIGTGFDGPEWTDPKNTNMFDALGVANASDVFSSGGETVKMLGGTTCGAVGYIESPSATKSVESFGKSCVAAGLKSGYITNVHFGSTDMAPVALKMKQAGVDSIFFATVPSTGFALAAALRVVGASTKAILLPTGYGGDLLKDKATVQAAQGFYFSSSITPFEVVTPASTLYKDRLAKVGYTDPPSYDVQTAYTSMAAFAAGLKATTGDLTQKSFSTAMRNVKGFDVEGLLGQTVDFSNYAPTKSCSFYVKLSGNKFVPVDGLDPICGTKIG